jgi:hypothetical protein
VSRLGTAAFLLAGAGMLHAPAALAQSADPPKARFEVGIGSLWIGAQPLGTKTATETTGAGSTLSLFNSSSELAGAAGVAGRIGVRVTRSFVAEVEASYLTPQLRIAISGDVEGAAAVTATETIQQVTVGGGVLWYLPNRGWAKRFAPFAMAGGGYLQQLHDPATLVETGHYYQFGGGATYVLVASPHLHTKGIGARVDVRALIRSKGVAFDDGGHTSPAFGVSAFVRF